MSRTTNGVTKEKLAEDLKVVVADAEELLRATAGQAGDKVSDKVTELRGRIEGRLADARTTLSGVQDFAIDKAKQAASSADDYVTENPWTAVGVGVGVGLLLGLLLGRR